MSLSMHTNIIIKTYFSFEHFLCLDLWGQFLFVELGAVSRRLDVVEVAASAVEQPPDCSLDDD